MIDQGYSDHADDLVAAYVLGAVTPAEAAQVEEHLATCAECRQLERELREVESTLPDLAGEMTPPPGLKIRLMAAVAAEAAAGAEPAGREATGAPAPIQPAPRPLQPRAQRAAWGRPRALLLLAAAVAVLAVAVVVWQVNSLPSNTPTRTYAMGGTPALPSVTGHLYYYKNGKKLVLDLSGLKQIPPDKVYELWLIKPTTVVGTTVAQGVDTFRPGADGKVHLSLSGYDVPSYTLSGLTVERAPRATKPTPPIVAEAKITG